MLSYDPNRLHNRPEGLRHRLEKLKLAAQRHALTREFGYGVASVASLGYYRPEESINGHIVDAIVLTRNGAWTLAGTALRLVRPTSKSNIDLALEQRVDEGSGRSAGEQQ